MNYNPLLLKCALALVIGATVSGCASFGHRSVSGNIVADRPAAVSVNAAADWSWSISGDAAIRPLQVFSLKGKTYLQMLPGQLIPAVLVSGEPVPFVVAPPYVVVSGTPTRMDLLSSGHRAVIAHRGPVAAPEHPVVSPNRVERVAADTAAPAGLPAAPKTRPVAHTPTDIVAPLQKALAAADEGQSRVWRIKPSQRLLSRALADWSSSAGIKLVWKSRVDVPITGPADYRDESFLVAMSHVLADASTKEFRFFFSMTDTKTVTVVALRAS